MPESNDSLPTPPTPAPSSPVPGGTPTAVWRAGPEAPAWARGKTAEEIMAVTNNLMESVARPQAPAPAPATPAAIDPNAYMTGQDLLNAQSAALAQMQPAFQRLAEQNAAATYRLVATDPKHSEVFQKYGPEVTQYLAKVPKDNWTVDLIEGAAKLVKADHLDDLVRDRTHQALQNMEPTIRPTGGGATPGPTTPDLSLKSDKLPTDWRDRAAKVGLTERELDEFCFANGMSREQFFQQFEKTAIAQVGTVKGA
jgi:hypothetical protein